MTLKPHEICLDFQRRADVRANRSNGIDYVDVSEEHPVLTVYFLREAPDSLEMNNVVIETSAGGKPVRPVELRMCSADDPEMDDCVRILLDRRGDRGAYTLRLVKADAQGDPTQTPMAGIDPRYSQIDFRFDAGTTTDIDCQSQKACPPKPLSSPDINYLAKDYTSFRQLILDRLALVMPDWQEQHVPDQGIALVEILAYVGDYLSYYQDAVATEAYLSTARQRISVRRHVRLLDYQMHEGCNARAWVTVNTSQDVPALDPAKIYFLAGYDAPAGSGSVLASKTLRAVPAGSYLVFEPVATSPIDLYQFHNEIRFYTWGNQQCCLPAGATCATLLDALQAASAEAPASAQVSAPAGGRRRRNNPAQSVEPEPRNPSSEPPQQRSLHLKAGDVLLLKEVVGPETGSPDDADPTHRQFVRLTKVRQSFDRLYNPPIPIVEVEWTAEDALTFPLCFSTIGPAQVGCKPITDVSVAYGNVLLVDHGAWTIGEPLGTVPLATTAQTCERANHPSSLQIEPGPFAPTLKGSPVTFRQSPGNGAAADELDQDPRSATPQILLTSIAPLPDGSGPAFSPNELQNPALLAARIKAAPDATRALVDRFSRHTRSQLKTGDADKVATALSQEMNRYVRTWTPRPDLLESQPDDFHYVVEVDDNGTAHLRFGDGELGRAVEAGETFFADYRVGNGIAGNVGSGAIRHVVYDTAGLTLTPTSPLPAQGGVDPEPVDEVKLYAPGTFLSQLERAITAEDYATLAEQNPKLQRAAATLLWTGTRYEARVAIDPLGTDVVDSKLMHEVEEYLYQFRRIGHDLVVVPAQYAPLDIAMLVDIYPDYLAGHVRMELLAVLGDQVLPNGKLGFFHPDRLSFGDGIYVSQLIATAQAVTGVESVTVTRLQRLHVGPEHELENGFLPIGPLEVAQLDNDPAVPERGKLLLKVRGGQ